MERLKINIDNSISIKGRQASADELGCGISELKIINVDGGYSRNRRSLVNYEDKWIFAKEVDCSLLPSDGAEELGWLRKDYECVNALISVVPEIVPDWEKLTSDGHVLLMPSYRLEDGWSWSLPSTLAEQHKYIQTVIDATKKLEVVEFDENIISKLNLQPRLRDKLALDDGLDLIIQNKDIQKQLYEKYDAMSRDESLIILHSAINEMKLLLEDDKMIQSLASRAASLINQPNNCFGHCDVRSDNIAYNSSTGEVKFIDWNWSSFATKRFGSTEFLVDMAKRGVDVSPWLEDLNIEKLASLVGFYTKRCLYDPIAPGNSLRDMQAQSAAIALDLYNKALNL